MNGKHIFLLGCMLALPLQVCALSKMEYLSLATVAGLTSWGFFERYKKNQHAKAVDQLQNEVQLYKTEALQLAGDQKFLSKLSSSLEGMAEAYSFVARESHFEGFYKALKAQIIKAGSLEKFEEELETVRTDLSRDRSSLELKIVYWQSKQPALQTKARELLAPCERMQALLNEIRVRFDEQRNFIAVDLIMDRASHGYTDEKELIRVLGRNEFERKLQEVVQRNYSEAHHGFPYLNYAQKIKGAKEELENELNKLGSFEGQPFQNRIIREARELLNVLERVFAAVVASPMHEQQRLAKPEFEKQEEERKRKIAKKQARLNAEVYEKEARANAVKADAETRLTEERRRAQEVANQRASLECEQRKCSLRQQEIELDREKIRQKEYIKEAIDKKDREWQAKYSSLQGQVGQSDQLRRRIDASKSELDQLKDALDVGIYVGAEHQQGVSNYINLLRRHLSAARSALS